MDYLFTDLEAKVKSLCQCLPNSHETKTAASELCQEISDQRKELELVLLKTFSEEELQEFTAIHHSKLLLLVAEFDEKAGDLLFKTKQRYDLKNAVKSASLGQAYDELHQLLKFLHFYFEKYISKEKFIPPFCHKAFVREIREFQKYTFKQLKDADPELVVMMTKPFAEFVKTPNKQSWHSFYYCHFLFNEFKAFVEAVQEITEDELISFFFLVNHNSSEFCNYYAVKLEELGLDLEGLYRVRKDVVLMDIRPNMSYKLERDGLIEHFKKWFEEQIYYQEHTGQSAGQKAEGNTKQNLSEGDMRFVVNVGVEKLTYKLRVDVEIGFLQIGVKERFFELIAKTHSTRCAIAPAVKNISNSYWSVTQQTKEEVLKYHQRAIEYIKENI